MDWFEIEFWLRKFPWEIRKKAIAAIMMKPIATGRKFFIFFIVAYFVVLQLPQDG